MEEIELNEFERLDSVNERLKLIQRTDGLTFGTDAYLLAAFMRRRCGARGAELGSGSGIISLLVCEKNKLSEVCALEVQPTFASLTERNAALNRLGDRIKVICRDIREATPSLTDGELDAVFSNPPYMKTGAGKRNENDGKYIARHEVCGGIGDFCAAAARLLKYGGLFYCVYRPDRLADLIFELKKSSLEPKKMIFVHADTHAVPSMVLVEAKKGGASGLDLMPPLIMYEDERHERETEALKRIYERCSFE